MLIWNNNRKKKKYKKVWSRRIWPRWRFQFLFSLFVLKGMKCFVLVFLIFISLLALFGAVLTSVTMFSFSSLSVDCEHNSKKCLILSNTTNGCHVQIEDDLQRNCYVSQECPPVTETVCYTFFGSNNAFSCDWSFNCRNNWALFVVTLIFGIFFLVSIPCVVLTFWSIYGFVYFSK